MGKEKRREKKTWEKLSKLRLKRGDADYDLNENFQDMEKSVRLYIKNADDIIKKVDKLTSSDFLKI